MVNELLSTREWDVIKLIARDGLTNDEVAAKLGIARSTVNIHKRNILVKTGARSPEQAIYRIMKLQYERSGENASAK